MQATCHRHSPEGLILLALFLKDGLVSQRGKTQRLCEYIRGGTERPRGVSIRVM